MTKVLVEESSLSGIADAIREKTGETATYKPREMAEAISKITGGGKTKFGMSIDNVIGDMSADGALSAPEPADVVLDGVTALRFKAVYYNQFAKSFAAPDLVDVSLSGAMQNAFYGNDNLASVDFPELKTISSRNAFNHAFFSCYHMTSLSFTKLEVVTGESAAYYMAAYCSMLNTISFPALTRVYADNAFAYAFNGSGLTSAGFPNLVSVSGEQVFFEAFWACYQLTEVSFPSLEVVAGSGVFRWAFESCSKLTSVAFPALVKIDCLNGSNDNMQFCGAVTTGSVTMSFPKLKEVYANGGSASYGPFASCSGLVRIDLPALTTIGTHYTGTSTVSDVAIKNMFYGCSSLKEIHFGSANQAAVEAMPGYDTLWGLGAGKVTVYFDL